MRAPDAEPAEVFRPVALHHESATDGGRKLSVKSLKFEASSAARVLAIVL